MILDEKMRLALGIGATLIALYSYVPYFCDIFRGKTKPHAFSWLVWGLLMVIGFAGQVSDGAGPGAWVIGFSACACLTIFVLALRHGEKNITRSDWWCLWISLTAIPLWMLTSTPLWSMLLITIIDFVGFAPTFRKSYHKPFEETVVVYTLGAIKHSMGIAALERFSLITLLYPLSLVLTNAGLAAMIMFRRSAMMAENKKLDVIVPSGDNTST